MIRIALWAWWRLYGIAHNVHTERRRIQDYISMAGKDYYAVLGVDKTASADEIKKAFRKKAHQYHPDKGEGNEDKFKEVSEAYQVLKDPQKRQQYDQFGAAGVGGGPGGAGMGGMNWQDFARQGGFNQGGVHFDFGDMGDLGDIFGDMFGFGGGRRGQGQSGRGADVEVAMEVPFLDAVFGVERTVQLDQQVTCQRCDGNGAEPNSKITSCQTCGGQGQVESVQQSMFGMARVRRVCPDCQGRGQRPEQVCSQCGGEGRVRGSQQITVSVPAGIDDGQRLRLQGKGQAGAHGQPAGDLYVLIRVVPDERWQRRGEDIITSQELSFKQAALGDKIDIETVHGPVTLKIPEGTQTGKVFRLRGKGVPRLNAGGHGDHLVEVTVVTPTKLNRKQKKALEELA